MKKSIIFFIAILSFCYVLAQPNKLVYNYDVSYYKLDLEVTNSSTYISGNVTVNATVVNSPLDTFVIELTDTLTVDSVCFEGNNHIFIHENDEIIVLLNSSYGNGFEFSIVIYYNGFAPTVDNIHGNSGGLMNSMDLTFLRNVTWSNSEPFNAKLWWPCKQIISDKADSVDFYLTTDTTLIPASIGKLHNISSLPEGKHRYEWKSRHPFPYYMVFFAVSEYEEFTFYAYPENSDSILIQCFFYNIDCWNYYSDFMAYAKMGIEYLSKIFGPYLFADEKYGYCAVPAYSHENLTMTSIKPETPEFHIYHALGHQWFAGNVTCETYKDIWLHEGFGTYSEYLCFKEFLGEALAQYWIQGDNEFIMSESGGSVFVPAEDEWNAERIYDTRLSYRKGQQLLHMVRFELQNDLIFYNVLHDYNQIYSGGIASVMDFKMILENISGLNFTDFFNQWYYGEGFPIYDIYYYSHDDSLTFTATQTTSSTITSLYKMPMEYKIIGHTIDTTIRVYQYENEENYTIYFPDSIYEFLIDPYNWVINGVGEIIDGIKDVDINNFNVSVFPNPTKGAIIVKGNDIDAVDIYNLQGQLLFNIEIVDEKTEIDLRNETKGFYIFKIKTKEGIITKKIIKH